MKTFLKLIFPDFLLALVLSTAMTMCVSFAFESAPELRGNVAIVGAISAVMLAVLYAGTWSRRMTVVCAVVAFAMAVAAVGISCIFKDTSIPLFIDGGINDVAENPVIFVIIAIIVPNIVFLLSRRRIGMVFLLLIVMSSCAIVQFLYRDWIAQEGGLAVSVIAIADCLAMFVFQAYRESMHSAYRIGKASYEAASLQSALISVICVGAGAVLFFSLVAPLGLLTPEIKPFEDYYTRPVIEFSGVYQEQRVDNPDLETDDLNDEQDTSNQEAEGGQDSSAPDSNDASGSSPIAALLSSFISFDETDWNEQFDAIRYELFTLPALLWFLLIIAIIVAIILLWRYRRTLRIKRFEKEELQKRVLMTYSFFCDRFKRLGIVWPPNLTPLEFAFSMRNEMQTFSHGTSGIDFLAVTLLFQRACFDEGHISEEDWVAVRRFYDSFFKNARDYVGAKRWLWKFWRI